MWLNSYIELIEEELKDRLLAIIQFGSSLYGWGRDIDLILILDEVSKREALEMRERLSSLLSKHSGYRFLFDIHPFNLQNFEENLAAGTFVSGLAIGYKILFDKIGLNEVLRRGFKRLAQLDYQLFSEGRRIQLSKLAEIRLRILERQRVEKE